MNLRVTGAILVIAIFVTMCDTENEQTPVNFLLGRWMIAKEHTFTIKNSDTLQAHSYSDERYIELKSDSLLVIYWRYPDWHDNSIWYEKGTDSLYLFFDGPNSKVVDRYRYTLTNDSTMLWEETFNQTKDSFNRTIYTAIKK